MATSTHTQRTYIDAAETAKLIRQALRESFPGTTFRVTTKKYSGGASVNVSWMDGPTDKQVESVAQAFQGGYFDGQIDYKGSRFHTLDGQPVQFMADFVFCNRHYSVKALDWAIMDVMTKTEELRSAPWPGVRVHDDGSASLDAGSSRDGGIGGIQVMNGRWYGDQLVYFRAQEKSYATAQPSKTLRRVAYTGSDGYGQG